MISGTLLGEALLSVPLAAGVAQDDGRYIACNDAFCALTGYSRREILELRAGLELGAGPKERSNFAAAVRGERSFGQDLLRRKDGSTLRTNWWVLPTRSGRLPNFLVLLWPVEVRPKRRQLPGA
jgi:PAS domain S-box-containing protein